MSEHTLVSSIKDINTIEDLIPPTLVLPGKAYLKD
jgi:hypothetical protein